MTRQCHPGRIACRAFFPALLAVALLVLWPGAARAMTTMEPPAEPPAAETSPHIRQDVPPKAPPAARPGQQGSPIIQKDKDGSINIIVPAPPKDPPAQN